MSGKIYFVRSVAANPRRLKGACFAQDKKSYKLGHKLFPAIWYNFYDERIEYYESCCIPNPYSLVGSPETMDKFVKGIY